MPPSLFKWFSYAEFVQLLSSEANEIATKEKKNTITPEHLLKAITELGFTDFIEEVTATMELHKEESKGERYKAIRSLL